LDDDESTMDVPSGVADLDLDALGEQIQGRLTASESVDDAVAAAEHLARRRAELLGREPTQADLEFAASIFCWYPFRTLPPEEVQHELALIRQGAVAGAARGDTQRLDEIVPDRTLVVNRTEPDKAQVLNVADSTSGSTSSYFSCWGSYTRRPIGNRPACPPRIQRVPRRQPT
jgi:alkanesulfonate monooxygenase SsuD/methylene tetrahydromethanopterin reductase-like flavin-dependent oxidoreductase (luciferase family)